MRHKSYSFTAQKLLRLFFPLLLDLPCEYAKLKTLLILAFNIRKESLLVFWVVENPETPNHAWIGWRARLKLDRAPTTIIRSMEEENILSDFLKQLESRLREIESRHHYLSFLMDERLANEKLLQLETMHILSQNPAVVDYLPEKPYDLKKKEKCDFWFKISNGTEFWMEIKTRPTNYWKTGHAKAITNGVDQVIKDVQRLKNITSGNVRKLVLFAFYPLYADRYGIFNSVHLPRISREIGKSVRNPKIRIRTSDGADFNLYLEQLP